jgi:glycosyltransferase involved in cell wall biosynthesis
MNKVLFINTLYTPNIGGGAEIIFQEQVEGFKKRGYQVVVLATGANKGLIKEYINDIPAYRAEIKNIYWHFAPNKSNKYIRLLWHLKDFYNFQMKKYVKEIIEKENPEIVVCHNLTGFSISIWDEIKKYKLPIIQVLHDMYLLCPNSNMFKNGHTCKNQCLVCRCLRLRHRQKSEQVDVVVGVSNFIINKVLNFGYFSTTKKQVIYNAREIKSVEKKDIWDGIRELKIGFIGTLSQSKGIEWLIYQFNELKINATLTIAGKGQKEYEKYLKEIAQNNDKIKFIGYAQSQEFYQQVDLVCMPSLWADTFPGVAYESCANGVPVIATNMGGLPEIIKNNVNGIIINPNEENSLKESILMLYNNVELFQKLAYQARAEVQDFLNVNRMLDEYEIIFKEQ